MSDAPPSPWLAGYSGHWESNTFCGEAFNDGGVTPTGIDQTLQGFIFTPEYDLGVKFSRLTSYFRKADGKLVVCGDIRLDLSNKNVFLVSSNPARQQQFTSAVNLIYLF
jgi:hypothetical protein